MNAELTKAAAWTSVLAGPQRGALEAALPAWLAGRRWFGGKARPIDGARVLDAIPIGPGSARVALVQVSYSDGPPETYVVPLAVAAGQAARQVEARDSGAIVARVAGADGAPGVVHAVDGDPGFARALVELVGSSGALEGEAGRLVGRATSLFPPRAEALAQARAAPLGAEQSNTSLRLGEVAVLKLFRRVEAGPSPEVEVGVFLSDVAGYAHAPPVLGGVEYRPRRGDGFAVAMLQGFVPNRGDAWRYVLGLLGGLLEGVSGRDPPPVRDAPLLELATGARLALGDEARPLLDSAALLGRRTAGLHLALASYPDLDAFRPEPFSAADARELHEEARGQVTSGLELLRRRRDGLPPPVRARADAVIASEDRLLRHLAEVLARPLTALRTRTHGDFHLGQVLWTGHDFVIIDFEGEPARPLPARRAKRSPLRDVAGMIRSFHYAAYAALDAFRARSTRADDERAQRWARAAYLAAAAAYLRGWLEGTSGSGLVPADPLELRALLDLHLTEKALYELAYELNNRPDWVSLPLQGIEDLLATGAPGAVGGGEATVPKEGTKEAPRAVVAREVREPAPARARGEVLPAAGPSDHDLHLWSEGTNHRAYRSLGAHLATVDGVAGTSFAVWAPNAERVSVIGDWNGWDKDRHVLRAMGPSGVWQGFIPGVQAGAVYKYHLRSRERGYHVDKADPFGFMHEAAPGTQSIVCDLDAHRWGDDAWMRTRRERNGLSSPMSIYEVHLGSWRRVPEDGNRSLTYRELATQLADYVQQEGFTHVELLPIMEHPFYGSWGYQTTGYFAPTSRYGSPQDFMFLVDTLHQRGIGVILDWVPSHFPADVHALSYFDGTHLFEHADRRQGHHPDWDSYIFNYGRNEVRSFLLSSAMFWLDRYHVDGLRVDAVASMLYLDYSRQAGEWIPNKYGGKENLDAIAFLRRMNEVVYAEHPDVQTIAEESTSWPMVSRPIYLGGLGFGMKWDMGWMHDTLDYMRHDPIYRRYHHNQLTFRMMYAFSENFVLALSHDEVVHGKRSLLDRMPGNAWEKFANLRLLYGYMWAQPGKKLLFMGGEFGQGLEWGHERSLDWHLLGRDAHAGVKTWVEDLNRLLRDSPAMHIRDFDPGGFEWIDCNDWESSVLALLRKGGPGDADVLAVLNFTPVSRQSYRVGVPQGGFWREVLNSDAPRYGGAGWGNFGGQEAAPVGAHGRLHSLALTLPPLSAVFFRHEPAG